MNSTQFKLAFLVTVFVCLLVHRMPAPITVPPEETPQTSAAGQETSAPKSGKAKATTKPAAPKEDRLSFAGDWSGTTVESYSVKTNTATLQQSWKVSNDEKTVTGWFIYNGEKYPPVQTK